MSLGVSAGAVTTLGIWPKCLLAFIAPTMLFPVPRYLESWDTQSALSLYTTAALFFYFLKNGVRSSEMAFNSIREKVESRKKDHELEVYRKARLDNMEQMVNTASSTQSYVDTDGVFQIVNNAFLKVHGKSREDVIGKTMKEVLPPSIYEGRSRMVWPVVLLGNRSSWRDG
jgi:transcriptional regulator with PAS, ATPase and Fis domain